MHAEKNLFFQLANEIFVLKEKYRKKTFCRTDVCITVAAQENKYCLIVIDFVYLKRSVYCEENEFNFHHFGKDWNRARPVTSDVQVTIAHRP